MNYMNNKELQKKRMLTYFVEATWQIIETEGIEAVTVRKVAQLAGYNSATLYNYFENLKHLIFYASLRHLKNYAVDLSKYLKDKDDPLTSYLNIWKCFCFHSYTNPQFYQMMFFGGFDNEVVNTSIASYYDIFANDLSDDVKEYIPMFIEENLYKRDYLALKRAADENIISIDDIFEINEMNILIYRGMLEKMLYNKDDTSVSAAVDTTIKYLERTLIAFGVDEKKL